MANNGNFSRDSQTACRMQVPTAVPHSGANSTHKDPSNLASSSQKKSQHKKTEYAHHHSIDKTDKSKYSIRNKSWRIIIRHTTMENMRGVRRKKSLTPNSRRRKNNFRQSLIPVGKRSKRNGGTRSRRGFNIRLILSHRARALFFYCC